MEVLVAPLESAPERTAIKAAPSVAVRKKARGFLGGSATGQVPWLLEACCSGSLKSNARMTPLVSRRRGPKG